MLYDCHKGRGGGTSHISATNLQNTVFDKRRDEDMVICERRGGDARGKEIILSSAYMLIVDAI